MSIDSKVGERTRVVIEFESKVVKFSSLSLEKTDEDEAEITFEKRWLLLVEDNEMNREIAQEIFTGCRIHC